jgi:integrase
MKKQRDGVKDLGDGKFLIRVTTADGKRRGRTVRAKDRDEAVRKRENLIAVLEEAGTASVGGVTFRGWALDWLDRQERAQVASAENLELNLRLHVLTAPWADDLLASVTVRDVRAHVIGLLEKRRLVKRSDGRKTLHPKTVQGVLTLIRAVFEDAVNRGILDVNPAREVQIPRAVWKTVEKVRTHLTPDEIRKFLSCEQVALGDRLLVAFALVTGLRAGELFSLKLSDLERVDGEILVHVRRAGHGKKTTKGKRTRVIPVFGPARAALEAQLAMVPRGRDRNPEQLVFPGPLGGRRWVNDAAEWIRDRLSVAGIKRHVRFHDLRHTAGTALVSGWLGHAWRKEDVQGMLGHASIAQTEHYAHTAPEALVDAARQTDRTDRAREWLLVPSPKSPVIPGKSDTSAGQTSSLARMDVVPDVSAQVDPFLILREAVEGLIADAAAGRLTAADVLAWRDLVVQHDPTPFGRLRELQDGPFVFREALAHARALVAWLDANAPATSRSGGAR